MLSSMIRAAARAVISRLPENGSGRLLDSIRWECLRFPENDRRVSCRPGVEMRVNPNDLIGRHLYYRKCFDPVVRDAILEAMGPDDVFLDVGANLGYMSCCVLRVRSSAKAYAVEPLRDIFEVLSENLRLNGGDRGIAIRAAVSDHAGTGIMERRAGNPGASHLSDGELATGEEVELLTLTGLHQRLRFPRADVMKIDVEGHERSVISSLRDLAQEQLPRSIIFEHHTKDGRVAPEMADTLDSLDYQTYRIVKRVGRWMLSNSQSPCPAGFVATSDYLATKRDGDDFRHRVLDK